MSITRFFWLLILVLTLGSSLRATSLDEGATLKLTTFSTPERWFTQGLTEEKNNDLKGENSQTNLVAASLSFRRALLLDPTLQPARTHLNLILAKLGIPVVASWQTQLLSIIHPDLLILGGAILGWLGVFSLVFLLMVKPPRPTLIAMALIAIILGHSISIIGTLIDPRRLASNQAVVIAKIGPTLRETPADSAKSEGVLAPGSLVSILSCNGVWWKISDGIHTGWILSTAITPLLPASVDF